MSVGHLTKRVGKRDRIPKLLAKYKKVSSYLPLAIKFSTKIIVICVKLESFSADFFFQIFFDAWDGLKRFP